jgi:hypothetical protein
MSVRSTSLLRTPAPVMNENIHFSRVCITLRSFRSENAWLPFELDLGDAYRLLLLDGVEDVDLVLADGLGAVVDACVEVALLDVELLRGLDPLPSLLGVEDRVRADLEGALDLLLLHLLRPLDLHVADERPLLHAGRRPRRGSSRPASRRRRPGRRSPIA